MTKKEEILRSLNAKQIEAVTAITGPVLILAGAGSGKTKALTHRIAYLIASGIPAHNILAVTFTNKASGEIKERVAKLVNGKIPYMGTFHSICLRILRQDIENLGYGKNFVIYDSDDQVSLVKSVMIAAGLDVKKFNPKSFLGRISELKSELVTPEMFDERASEFRDRTIVGVYTEYQSALKRNSALDFDDLIMLTVQLFQKFPAILEKYQNIFQYILIDEYQDTNHAQYVWATLLAKKNRNIAVVGDDAQCFPSGTFITTAEGTKKIEDVRTGDSIISPAGRGNIHNARVAGIKKFHYTGSLYTITTRSGLSVTATPNHIVFGKLLPSAEFHLVYLMYAHDIGFRIGITVGLRHSRKTKKNLGLDVRANQEKADKMWILKVCQSRSEAIYNEAFFAFQYGIPTTVFFTGRSGRIEGVFKQKYIEQLYSAIPTRERVKKLLSDLDLSFDYPHHRPGGTIRYTTRRITVNIVYFSHAGGPRMKSLFRRPRVTINTSDSEVLKKLAEEGLHARKGKAKTWRIETARANATDAEELALRIAKICGLEISRRALITNRSFDFLPISQLHQYMTVPILKGGMFVDEQIASVEKKDYQGYVYDLDIEKTHTYTANGFAVHNSIYGFRKADIRNILDFEKDYPEAKIVYLEQNYRSTQTILEAANHVITNNRGQKQKKLWTDNPDGEKIFVKESADTFEESQYVIDHLKQGSTILYRTHAQSRALEEALVRHGIPYRILGGLRFYERREIKDILAYLRLIANPSDTVSFARICNTPPRGLGPVALKNKTGPYVKFQELMDELRAESERLSLSALVRYILKKIDYEAYIRDKSTEGEDRWENVKELLTAAAGKKLENFLEEVALIQETDKLETGDGAVNLMTLHSAKGLEFPVVFITGLEDGVFPHSRSLFDPAQLEEERRLCYVGITRARDELHLVYCRQRMLYGSTQVNPPSRFLFEIPEKYVTFIPAQEIAGSAFSY